MGRTATPTPDEAAAAAAEAAGMAPAEARRAVRVLLGAVFLDLLAVALVIPLMPKYAARAGMDPALYGVLGSMYGVGQLAGAPLMGQVSDQRGRRTVLLVSAAGTAVSYLLMGFASSVTVLFVSRLPVGVVKQTSAAAQAYMTDVTAPAERNQMLGRVETAISVAFIVGPVLGGLLSLVSHELPAVVSASLLAAECVLIYTSLPEPRHRPARGVLAEGEVCPATGAAAADGAADAGADAARCPATGAPAAPKRSFASTVRGMVAAFRDPRLTTLMATALGLVFGVVLNQTTMLLSLQSRYDLSPEKNGLVIGYAGALNSIVQGLAIAPLTRRFTDHRLTVLSLLLMGLALLVSSNAPTLGVWLAVQPLVAAGKAVARTTVTASATKAVDPARVGATLGTLGLFSSVSRIAAPVVGGLLQHEFGYASVDAAVGGGMVALAAFVVSRPPGVRAKSG